MKKIKLFKYLLAIKQGNGKIIHAWETNWESVNRVEDSFRRDDGVTIFILKKESKEVEY